MIYQLDDRIPKLDPDSWVAPNAQVMGTVEMHAGSSVWFGAVLRGDNEPIVIGEESNIQDNSVIHTDPGAGVVVGKGVTVGHKVVLHGCTIGDYALVGIGAVVLNHAVIGAGSLIGAGALVTEGTEIPPGSLAVGAPARVVRELTEEQRQGLVMSAKHYAQNWRRFVAGLKRLD